MTTLRRFVFVGVLFASTVGFAVHAAPDDKVTICHATGSGMYNRIVTSENGINGHFENNGTPKDGHEDDLLFVGDVPCPGDPTPTPSVTPTPSGTPTPTPPAEIHGTKFEDINANGARDVGEPGLSGWTINFYDGSFVWLASMSTDASGEYWFMDLDAGTYNIREVQQAGWTQTTANPAPIIADWGDVVTGIDFGNFENVDVSGWKWHDINGNAVWDLGEPALAGWTITLDGADSIVTTSSLGYTFFNVGPGAHTLCETMQSGWRQTYPGVDMCHTVVVDESGVAITDVNFGNISDREGTQGFWRNWSKHKQYAGAAINGWLDTIDSESKWIMSEAGYADTTSGMVKLINDATKQCNLNIGSLACAKLKFLTQYMVTRLDITAGRKTAITWYAVPADAQILLGLDPMEHLGDIIAATEAWTDSGLRVDYTTLAPLFDSINNTGI